MASKFRNGDTVVYKANLGAMDDPSDSRFSGTVEAGQQGRYIGRHPNRKLHDWHIVVDVKSGKFVPVHINQIEKKETRM